MTIWVRTHHNDILLIHIWKERIGHLYNAYIEDPETGRTRALGGMYVSPSNAERRAREFIASRWYIEEE